MRRALLDLGMPAEADGGLFPRDGLVFSRELSSDLDGAGDTLADCILDSGQWPVARHELQRTLRRVFKDLFDVVSLCGDEEFADDEYSKSTRRLKKRLRQTRLNYNLEGRSAFTSEERPPSFPGGPDCVHKWPTKESLSIACEFRSPMVKEVVDLLLSHKTGHILCRIAHVAWWALLAAGRLRVYFPAQPGSVIKFATTPFDEARRLYRPVEPEDRADYEAGKKGYLVLLPGAALVSASDEKDLRVLHQPNLRAIVVEVTLTG